MTEHAPSALRWLGSQVPALGGQLSGIVGDKNHTYGYHRGRNYVSWGDYSTTLPEDRLGDGEAASAIDMSFPPDKMRLYTQRLVDATNRNDPRLRYIREFYGTTNGSTVTGRTHSGESASWNSASSDSSHLWHIHISFFRKYSNSTEAVQSVLSVLNATNAPTNTGTNTSVEDDMPLIAAEMPPGKGASLVIRPPWGVAGWSKTLVSVATDLASPDGAKLRVVVHSATQGLKESIVTIGKTSGGETKDIITLPAVDRVTLQRLPNDKGDNDPQTAPIGILVYGS